MDGRRGIFGLPLGPRGLSMGDQRRPLLSFDPKYGPLFRSWFIVGLIGIPTEGPVPGDHRLYFGLGLLDTFAVHGQRHDNDRKSVSGWPGVCRSVFLGCG